MPLSEPDLAWLCGKRAFQGAASQASDAGGARWDRIKASPCPLSGDPGPSLRPFAIEEELLPHHQAALKRIEREASLIDLRAARGSASDRANPDQQAIAQVRHLIRLDPKVLERLEPRVPRFPEAVVPAELPSHQIRRDASARVSRPADRHPRILRGEGEFKVAPVDDLVGAPYPIADQRLAERGLRRQPQNHPR